MLKILNMIAMVLTIVAALNQGLIGVADLNIIGKLLGAYPLAVKGLNILFGLSGAWLAVKHLIGDCNGCEFK